MVNPIVVRDPEIDLAKSHNGGQRVFFVGDYWWQRISRPVSQRFMGQRVKTHSLWHFVEMKNVDRMFIAEIPFLSWWHNRRQTKRLSGFVPNSNTGKLRYNRLHRVSHDRNQDNHEE